MGWPVPGRVGRSSPRAIAGKVVQRRKADPYKPSGSPAQQREIIKVKNYVYNIYWKLSVDNRYQLTSLINTRRAEGKAGLGP